MKEIKQREFIRSFPRYKNELEKIRVIDKNGLLIGVYISADILSDRLLGEVELGKKLNEMTKELVILHTEVEMCRHSLLNLNNKK